ncbi:uncharacterized protein N7484_008613 [Penicillium longicatenatum]|uniref:uncharacterized protein n=1 Tax=Penicillium longicatenatum TaxID=1561947 RepID=UPI002548E97C|nr:uncharacterized protein N7484_008613 [Penicillium longicatenatum]KAJ5635300.1 hypothetical protein N7484_008613 [Penicillium longicatenatum]
MSANYNASFSGSNEGVQIGVNNGSLNTGGTYHLAEQFQAFNTQGGAVFSGNITANRDVNITHINEIRPIAQSLYTSLFSSSELFNQIRNELGLFVSILNVTEEHTQRAHAKSNHFTELKDTLDNCNGVLHDLSKLKDHFDTVGPQTQVTWERMGWAEVEIADIRSRLSVYINVLNVLNTQIIQSSQDNVERMLKAFMNEIRTGRRESSIISIVSTGSLSESEEVEWRQLRKELQSIGITPEIFSLNRDFIHTTLRALSQGEFGNLGNLPTVDEDVSTPAGFFSPGPNAPEISFTPRPSSQDDYSSSQDPMSLPKPTPSIYYQPQKNQRISDTTLSPRASQTSLDELDKADMANGHSNNSGMSMRFPTMKRKISDIYHDELYNPSITAAPISKSVGQNMMAPRNTILDQLQAGNQGHLPTESRFPVTWRPPGIPNAAFQGQGTPSEAPDVSTGAEAVSISQYGFEHDSMQNNTSPSLVPRNDYEIAGADSDDPFQDVAVQEGMFSLQDINNTSVNYAKHRIHRGGRFHPINCDDAALGKLTSSDNPKSEGVKLLNRAISSPTSRQFNEVSSGVSKSVGLYPLTAMTLCRAVSHLQINRDQMMNRLLVLSPGYLEAISVRHSYLPPPECSRLWIEQVIQFIPINREETALDETTTLNNLEPNDVEELLKEGFLETTSIDTWSSCSWSWRSFGRDLYLEALSTLHLKVNPTSETKANYNLEFASALEREQAVCS